MRPSRASNTAKLVTLWRALADSGATTVPGFRDPFAEKLLSGPYRFSLPLLRSAMARMPSGQRALSIGNYDVIPIRVVVIDTQMLEAVKAGCRQVVVLGAGFDTRAYRFEALRGVKIFEVDHPATQAAKRARTRYLSAPYGEVVYVPMNFERDSLADRLQAAGHDASAPTVWLWEGVVMYLADDAVRSSLDAIRRSSAAGSTLVVHYHEPSRSSVRRGVRGVVLSLLGEPQIGVRDRVVMSGLVERAGFEVTENLSTEEQAAKIGAIAPNTDLARVSRILAARLR